MSPKLPVGTLKETFCSGHIARSMGLPIDKLIVATNENDVLDEFFRTGNYQVELKLHADVLGKVNFSVVAA